MKVPNSQILVAKPSNYWISVGEKRALQLFKAASDRVPAYRKFLKEHRIDPGQIRTTKDLIHVPYITKDNYFKKYPLHELVWDGDLSQGSMISRSSGSSGNPFYWLSNQQQRDEVGEFYDLVFSLLFDMRRKRTLVIIAYGMGSWVAGTTTLLSSMPFVTKHKCTIVTPGYNKKEIVEICQAIGKDYEQIVICAYPPLAKEVVDLGLEEGVNWKKLKPKFIFGSEAFSEEFRDYILQRVGSKDPLLDTANTIGAAETMVMGHETPLSTSLRRLISQNTELHDEVLGAGRMPTLGQSYPWQKYLETVNDELLITCDGATPLIRYNIRDYARIYTYQELERIIQKYGYKDLAAALPPNLREQFDWKLPFLLLYSKSTNAVKIYGALVYPENIKAAIEKPALAENFTGKFRVQVFNDAEMNQRLRLFIELAPGRASKDFSMRELQKIITKEICTLNAEYKCVYTDIGTKVAPQIKLIPYGQFEADVQKNKHRYVV